VAALFGLSPWTTNAYPAVPGEANRCWNCEVIVLRLRSPGTIQPIFGNEDAAELHQAIADEGIVHNLARAPWPYTVDDAGNFATQAHDALYPSFLIMLRTHGAPRIIGACSIGNYDGNAELGYWIMRPYWGLGFATEASRAVLHIAQTIGHAKLIASHFTDNPASGNVLRKLGFQNTGETAKSNGRGEAMTCALY
jgi:RimJ/RimL family protein N-acetyltransferase